MNKKILICLLALLILFTGCTRKKETNNEEQKSKEVKTTLSCFKEGYLFHSKKSVEHIIKVDADNNLLYYEYIEKYYDFDGDYDFNMICEGAPEEAENNNKTYDYMTETADCNKSNREVTISDVYKMDKLNPKKSGLTDDVKTYLSDDLVMDIIGFRKTMIDKEYSCVQR